MSDKRLLFRPAPSANPLLHDRVHEILESARLNIADMFNAAQVMEGEIK